MDHQQLGQALAEHWKFPRTCQLVAGAHHQTHTLSAEDRALVTIVAVADVICCERKKGFWLTARHQKIESLNPGEIGLSQELIDRTAGKLDELVNAASPLMA